MSLTNLSNQLKKSTKNFQNKLERKTMPTQEAYGTEKLGKVIDALGRIAELLIVNLKDGVQISDTMIIPSLISEVIHVSDSIPGIEQEIKDLSLEELGYVIGQLTNSILKVVVNVKTVK